MNSSTVKVLSRVAGAAVLAGMFAAPALAGTIAYTSSAGFAAGDPNPLVDEDYGSYTAGQTISNPGTLGALSYSFTPGPFGMLQGGIITNQFASFTGQSLGGNQSNGAQYFFGGDSVTIVFPRAVTAVGVFFNVNPDSGNYTLTSSVGSVSTGSSAYDTRSFVFDGLVSTTGFTSITIFSTSLVGSYNIPEIEYSFAVPEPMTLTLFGAGLAGAALFGRRKKAGKQST